MRLPYCETGPGPGPGLPEGYPDPVLQQEEILERQSSQTSQLPDNIPDNCNFQVPLSIGICKQCKKFYSPEVWSISLLL